MDCVQNKHNEGSHIAFNLVERLFENCADTIKLYLSQAIKSLGFFLDNYSAVLSSIFTKVEICEQCIMLPVVTTLVADTLKIGAIEKLPKLMSLNSNILDVLDFAPTMLHEFHFDLILVFPQLHDTPRVATLLSKVIVELHTCLIDFRMLLTNYRHALLNHHHVDGDPKFHTKLKR